MSYAAQAAQAKRQIRAKGRSVTLRRLTQGTYSAAADAFTGKSTADTTVKAVITDFSQNDDTFGDLVERGDKKALIAASDLTSAPSLNDTILDGTTQYRIVGLKTVAPGDTDILHKLLLRK